MAGTARPPRIGPGERTDRNPSVPHRFFQGKKNVDHTTQAGASNSRVKTPPTHPATSRGARAAWNPQTTLTGHHQSRPSAAWLAVGGAQRISGRHLHRARQAQGRPRPSDAVHDLEHRGRTLHGFGGQELSPSPNRKQWHGHPTTNPLRYFSIPPAFTRKPTQCVCTGARAACVAVARMASHGSTA